MRSAAYQKVAVLEISDVFSSTDRGICVVMNGKKTWLPRKHTQTFPGKVVIPEWLARKLFKGESSNGKSQ
jgi:hypothetical protein